jgi:hypothetical protein
MRIDLLFSYWIIIWYLLYELRIIKYNPKFWFIVALVSNFYNFYLLFYFQRYYTLFMFSIFIFIFKGIPLWTLRNTKIKMNDIIAGAILFMIYYIWLNYNNETMYSLYHKFYISIRDNKPTSSDFMYFLNIFK